MTSAAGDCEYTITPALIVAVGRRKTDADITPSSAVTASPASQRLSYAFARARGMMTHRLMAEDLDISPLAAEMILQALRPVVHAH